jgi:hypothetical protein
MNLDAVAAARKLSFEQPLARKKRVSTVHAVEAKTYTVFSVGLPSSVLLPAQTLRLLHPAAFRVAAAVRPEAARNNGLEH